MRLCVILCVRASVCERESARTSLCHGAFML